MNRIFSLAFPLALAAASLSEAATVIAPTEDVMTSGFFQGDNRVRGYASDGRDVHRVSTPAPFGTAAAETIYLTFDAADFAALSAPVSIATVTLESISGGFGADAAPASPFTVSAHAVDADPLVSITDDTNPAGPIDWITFYDDNIQPADAAANTVVAGFGAVQFDVTSIVNDWLSGANSVFALAITGKNDASGVDFLHGFANNSHAPGSTFLTVTQVPEPRALLLLLASLVVTGAICQPLWRHRHQL